MKRCANELVSAVLLVGVIAVTAVITTTWVLRYMFEHYRITAHDVESMSATGVRTTTHLLRYGDTLYLVVSAKGQGSVTVGYTVVCRVLTGNTTVIARGELNLPVGVVVVLRFQNVTQQPCVAVISEANSVVYKVVEG